MSTITPKNDDERIIKKPGLKLGLSLLAIALLIFGIVRVRNMDVEVESVKDSFTALLVIGLIPALIALSTYIGELRKKSY